MPPLRPKGALRVGEWERSMNGATEVAPPRPLGSASPFGPRKPLRGILRHCFHLCHELLPAEQEIIELFFDGPQPL